MTEEISLSDILAEAGFAAERLFDNVIRFTEWFFRTVISQIDNREIATIILLLAIILFAAAKDKKGSLLKSFGEVIACATKPKLLIPALLLILYSLLLIKAAELLGAWSPDILLDTIIEVLFVGLPAMAIAVGANSVTSIFKRLVLSEISLSAFAAFYTGIKSFSIPAELLIQVVVLFFACGKLVWERMPDGKQADRLSDIVLAVVGLIIFGVMTYQLINARNTVDWIVQLQTFLMAIWYPLFMMPFFILLGYYAAFESVYLRVKIGSKRIGILQKLFLFLELSPCLRNITHFGSYEAGQYAECPTWSERHSYCKNYKDRIKKEADRQNSKLKRMEAGKGKRGFDENGLWLDWDNLEKIKTALWTIASVQNNNWRDKHAYEPDMQIKLVDVFAPRGCISGSYVSEDRKLYACWIRNGTGFTFGMAAAEGAFPPLRYEGERAPIIDPRNPLREFISDQQEDSLPNWFSSFYTDDSYR